MFMNSFAKQNQANTVIDLFAGCGGLSLGLYQAGWEGLFAAIEKNAFAFETLKDDLIDYKKTSCSLIGMRSKRNTPPVARCANWKYLVTPKLEMQFRKQRRNWREKWF